MPAVLVRMLAVQKGSWMTDQSPTWKASDQVFCRYQRWMET
jgi:hypothetical protein